MKKAQTIKLWEAVQETTLVADVISSFENKIGYAGRRTLERYLYAKSVFEQHLPLEEIVRKTGWGLRKVNKLEEWFDEWSSSEAHPKNVKSDRIEEETLRSYLLTEFGTDLQILDVFDVRDPGLAIWYSRPNQASCVIPGGYVERSSDGHLVVRLSIEQKIVLPPLRLRLKNDEIWVTIESWKNAVANDIKSRLNLLHKIIGEVESETHLKVLEIGLSGGCTGVDIYYVFRIYERLFCNAVGVHVAPLRTEDFTLDKPHTILLGGQPVIRHQNADLRASAIDYFVVAQSSLEKLSEIMVAVSAYREAQLVTSGIRQYLEWVRLPETLRRVK